MKMSQAQYDAGIEDNAGYCTHCECLTNSDVEPDADNYECEECGNSTVQGIENALIYENIEITDDDSDDDEADNVISFSDEDED